MLAAHKARLPANLSGHRTENLPEVSFCILKLGFPFLITRIAAGQALTLVWWLRSSNKGRLAHSHRILLRLVFLRKFQKADPKRRAL